MKTPSNWWAEILEPGVKNTQPAQYFVTTFDVANASALSLSVFNDKFQTHNPDVFSEIFKNGFAVGYYNSLGDLFADENAMHNGLGAGLVFIGKNMGINENDGQYGFANAPYYALPVAQSMKQLEITPVMFHEIGHSLGIAAANKPNDYGLKYNNKEVMYFDNGASNPNNFTYYLYDQYGRKAEEGMLILSNEMFNDENLRAQYLEITGEELTADKVFFLDNINAKNGRKGETYAYFAGKNVTEVLDGKTYIRGGDGVAVSGIPINQWEDNPELSHVEIARCLMSHQFCIAVITILPKLNLQ